MKLPVPEQKKKVYTAHIPMRWGDMDAYGHANNAIYMRYFEEARILWMTASGGRTLVQDGTGPVVANIFCNFYRPLEYPCDMLITLYTTEPGNTSADVWMTIARADAPDVVCADGGATMVWIDLATQKPVPLPPRVREVLITESAT